MRSSIISLVLIACILFLACKKTRTCSCKYETSATTVTTPRGTAQPATATTNRTGESDVTRSKVKKDDMIRIYGCNSRTETSGNTYTTLVSGSTTTIISGVTVVIPTTYVADVVSNTQNNYTCEIK